MAMTGRDRRVKALASTRRYDSVPRMTDKDKAKEERLAAALRDNLRRRKAQARASNPPPPKVDD